MKCRVVLGIGLLAVVVGVSPVHASLTTFQSFTGDYNVSTDGCGSTSQSCTLTANAESSSTVVAAYLYTSTYNTSGITAPTVGGTLNGETVTYTSLGVNAISSFFSLTAFRADVTSIVAPVIDSGAGGAYNFTYTETNSLQDGGALVVVYSNGSFATTTIGILDGFSAVTGDSTAINFANPLDPTAAGFEAEMRLGIGFSAGSTFNQTSSVTVNGTLITQSAGGFDDGTLANGALITMGGDNDPFSALLPSGADDHERYSLLPYITAGDTSITVNTLNPSHDDNIFLAVFKVTGEAGFNQPPPTNNVPEPGTLALLGIALTGLGLRHRKG